MLGRPRSLHSWLSCAFVILATCRIAVGSWTGRPPSTSARFMFAALVASVPRLRSAKRWKPRLVGVVYSSLRSSRPVSCQRRWSRAEKHRGAASPQQHNCLFRVGCLSPSICASLLELPSRSARRSAVLRPGGFLLNVLVQHAQLQAAVHMSQPGIHASDRLAAPHSGWSRLAARTRALGLSLRLPALSDAPATIPCALVP